LENVFSNFYTRAKIEKREIEKKYRGWEEKNSIYMNTLLLSHSGPVQALYFVRSNWKFR
jgi:hypothetical protein